MCKPAVQHRRTAVKPVQQTRFKNEARKPSRTDRAVVVDLAGLAELLDLAGLADSADLADHKHSGVDKNMQTSQSTNTSGRASTSKYGCDGQTSVWGSVPVEGFCLLVFVCWFVCLLICLIDWLAAYVLVRVCV